MSILSKLRGNLAMFGTAVGTIIGGICCGQIGMVIGSGIGGAFGKIADLFFSGKNCNTCGDNCGKALNTMA